MSSREQSLRARIAYEHCRRDPDPDLIDELQRERAVVRIEDFAAGVFTAAPQLRAGQREHRAGIRLKGGAGAVA